MNTQVSTVMLSDGRPGGAHMAALRLKKALNGTGLAVRWLAAQDAEGVDEAAAQWPALLPYLIYRLACYATRDRNRRERLRRCVLERTLARRLREWCPAVVNLHNLHGHLTSAILGALPRTSAVIWTVHDMWPLTGRCCYGEDCQKLYTGCLGECSQAGSGGFSLRSPAAEWRQRQGFFKANAARLAFVSPSEWLARVARKRLGPEFRVVCIPNSVNTGCFRPLADRQLARRALGLPEQGGVILAGAHWIGDTRKGMGYLREAVHLLNQGGRKPFSVVVFGENESENPQKKGWLFNGFVRDERLMNLFYNAADVYVLPSLADNLPNMLVESQTAGTPGVAFDVGGCGEIIDQNLTGILVKPRDSAGLAQGIGRILDLNQEERDLWSRRCRERAVARYSPPTQAAQYRMLFDEMVKKGV